MNILILGGTGAMGVPLIRFLSENQSDIVYVTSRTRLKDQNNIHYLCGNAMSFDFVKSITDNQMYDCIVDFMDYPTDIFKKNIDLLLHATKQYVYLSSSRVYAESLKPITESSNRLYDVTDDQTLLSSDVYPIHKAIQENMVKELCKSYGTNYTIIRPYITYNSYRLQLGTAEKEKWLYRAIKKRTIVVPRAILEKTTTLTFGDDVAKVMSKFIGRDEAYNEVFHISGANSMTWGEILEIYLDTIEEELGFRPNVKITDHWESYAVKFSSMEQTKYDRLYDRIFDNSKADNTYETIVHEKMTYVPTEVGLKQCLKECLHSPKWRYVSAKDEAGFDKITQEYSRLSEFGSFKRKVNYILNRFIFS